MQFAIGFEGKGKPFITKPYDIRRNIVIIIEDNTRGKIGLPFSCFIAPLLNNSICLSANFLMMPVRLFCHVKFSINDFIPLAIVRQ